MESSDFIGWIIFSVVVGGLLGWLGGAFVGVILYFFNLIARKEPVQEEISSSDAFEDATSEAERKPTPDEALAEIDRMNAKIFINEFQDSLNIMQKTANPETFFSRYDLVLERLDNMIELQQRGIKFTCDLPSLKTQALDEETTAETVNVLIDNAYAKQVQKLSTLKTERGRSNSTQRWYASFEPFLDRMPLRSKTYLEMKHTALQEV